jgi:hypothetical protein
MPTGELMCEKVLIDSIKSFKLISVTFIILKKHNILFNVKDILLNISKKYNVIFNIHIINKLTNGPAESAFHYLSKQPNIKNIIIRDCDSLIEVNNIKNNNFVVYTDISKQEINFPGSKSFIKFNLDNRISDIFEKNIVSPYISIGIYGFYSSFLFNKAFIAVKSRIINNEIYISHVIRELISENYDFWAIKAKLYVDLGTSKEFTKYQKISSCFICDIDGVIIKNQSEYFNNNTYDDKPIPLSNNVSTLLNLSSNGATIIFVTARKNKYRKLTNNILRSLGFINFTLIMGLPHAPRILINDFADSNQYPSALSINIKRDDDNLDKLINVY